MLLTVSWSLCFVLGVILLTLTPYVNGGTEKGRYRRTRVRRTHTRQDLTINNCEGYMMKFGEHRHRIYVDKYCNSETTAYVVDGGGDLLGNGIYEKYGRMQGSDRFELVLENGTVYTLGRVSVNDQRQVNNWVIFRNDHILYSAVGGSKTMPPEGGWHASGQSVSPPPSSVTLLSFPKTKLKSKRTKIKLREQKPDLCEISADHTGVDSCSLDHGGAVIDGYEESELLAMLHPAVGTELGDSLHNRYRSAYPVDSITLDGLLEPKALSHALTFLDVPLSSWIGPEEGFYCCKQKYRLNFTEWPRSNPNVIGVQQLLSSHTFIGFLEHLSGISNLVPMTADDDERMLWAGSSLIAISPGGYLHVHNDVSKSLSVWYVGVVEGGWVGW